MILGRQVVAPGLDAIEPDRRFAEDVRRILHQQETPFVFSRLLTVASPVADRTSKRDLWNEFGAGGVDMETYHVAAACHAAGIPWLAVRVVIDTASQSLPRSLASWSAEADNRRAGRVAATRPLEWPRYARLARQYPAAKRSLGVGVRAVVRAARSAPTAETLTLVEVH
jgi:nucleoside phosphorylase